MDNKRYKIIIFTIIIFVILVLGSIIGYVIATNQVIGTYYGSEYEFIEIDGVTYEIDSLNPYSSSDRGRKIGKVVWENEDKENHRESMYIWTVKGTDDYIYRVWGFSDGAFYKKVE